MNDAVNKPQWLRAPNVLGCVVAIVVIRLFVVILSVTDWSSTDARLRIGAFGVLAAALTIFLLKPPQLKPLRIQVHHLVTLTAMAAALAMLSLAITTPVPPIFEERMFNEAGVTYHFVVKSEMKQGQQRLLFFAFEKQPESEYSKLVVRNEFDSMNQLREVVKIQTSEGWKHAGEDGTCVCRDGQVWKRCQLNVTYQQLMAIIPHTERHVEICNCDN